MAVDRRQVDESFRRPAARVVRAPAHLARVAGDGPVTAVDTAQHVGATAGGGGAVVPHPVRRPLRGRLTGAVPPLAPAARAIAARTPARQGFRGRADGEPRIFARTTLPLCERALDVVAPFGSAAVRQQRPFPLVVAGGPSDHTSAGALPAPVPSQLAHLPPQKSFLRGITTGAIKG